MGDSKKLAKSKLLDKERSEDRLETKPNQSKLEEKNTIKMSIKKGKLKIIHKRWVHNHIKILERFQWKKFLYKTIKSLKTDLISAIIKNKNKIKSKKV